MYLGQLSKQHLSWWCFCHTWLHLGFSAKLTIWQVSACKMKPQRGIILDPKPPNHPPTCRTFFFWLLHNLGSWNLPCNLRSQKWDFTRCLGHLSRQHLSWWHLFRSFCTLFFPQHFVDTKFHLCLKFFADTIFQWPQKNVGTQNDFKNQNLLE